MEMLQAIFFVTSFITVWLSLVWIEFLLNPPKTSTKPKRLPTITIGIPAYNEEKGIGRTLNSLLKLDYPQELLEIIVVNDGSKDKTAQIAKKFAAKHPQITVINKKNGGKPSAVNRAIEKATGELFAVLDADSEVAPNSLKTMLPFLEDPKTGAAITRIKVEDGNFLQNIQRFEYVMSNFLRKIMSHVNILSMTPGVLSVYKTDLLKKLGGFTKDRNNLTEDLEIALRLKNAGYNVAMAMDAETTTTAPSTVKALWRQRIRWYRGYVSNHLKYKHMFFSKRHGLFGVFYLPVNVTALILLVLNASIISYNVGRDGMEFAIRSLTIPNYFMNSLIDFPTIQEFVLARDLLITIPILAILAIGIWMAVKAHSVFKENIRRNVLYGIVYTLAGPYFTTANWISTIYQEVTNSKRRWR